MRKMSDLEAQIIVALLQKNPDQRSKFLRHRDTYECSVIDELGSIKIAGENTPILARNHNGPFVTGYHDAGLGRGLDEPQIELILFLEYGKLNELQIFRQDGKQITVPISPAQVYIPF